MCFGGDDGSAQLAQQQRQQEQQRQANITTGMGKIDSAFSGFTPDYYNGITQSFLGYYKPQIDDQYKEAQRQTTFNLARGGNLDSSEAGREMGLLQRDYDNAYQGVQSQAIGASKDAQANVQQQKMNLQNQLEAGASQSTVADNAGEQAMALTKPPAYSPLANMFQAYGSQLGNASLASQAGYYGLNSFGPMGSAMQNTLGLGGGGKSSYVVH